jgi:hypothetical protein
MTAKALILLIRAYQVVLSPFFGGACRFLPSCSAYAVEAIATTARGAGRSWPPGGCRAAIPRPRRLRSGPADPRSRTSNLESPE